MRNRTMSGESEKPLGGDGGGGAIDGFPGVVRVGGFVQVTAQAMQMRGTRVPHGDAVGAGVFEVKLRRGIRGAAEGGETGVARGGAFGDLGPGQMTGGIIEFGGGNGFQELELFGEAAEGPGEATGPGGER
jgi:hypothetical protein